MSAIRADETENRITLGILTTVADASAVSQRGLAKELGIALGLTNAYVKRCVRKGLVKMREVPPHRYAYYLTPEGFAEKGRLTARYLARSFHFYREAKHQIDACFTRCVERSFLRVALCGAGELAEIAVLVAMRHPVTLVAVIDERVAGDRFLALPLVRTPAAVAGLDAVLMTDIATPQQTFQNLRRTLDDERIFTPPVLNVSRQTNLEREGA